VFKVIGAWDLPRRHVHVQI